VLARGPPRERRGATGLVIDLDELHRREWARVVATLARSFDLDTAEDAAAEAFVIALERWPAAGVPDNPGAWLVTAARNRRWTRSAASGPGPSAKPPPTTASSSGPNHRSPPT